MIALITLIVLLGPAVAAIALVFYVRSIFWQIHELRKELAHRAENDIKMFNANREAAGLEAL